MKTEKEIREQIQILQEQLKEIKAKETSIGISDIVRIKKYKELDFEHEYVFVWGMSKDKETGQNIYEVRPGRHCYRPSGALFGDLGGGDIDDSTPQYDVYTDEKYKWLCKDSDLELVHKFSYWNARNIQAMRAFSIVDAETKLSLEPLGIEVKCVIPFEGEFDFHIPNIQEELNGK